MTAGQAREVLALLETAADLLAQAQEVVAMAEVGTYPERGKKARLKTQMRHVGRGMETTVDTCRVVLRMEERWAVRAETTTSRRT